MDNPLKKRLEKSLPKLTHPTNSLQTSRLKRVNKQSTHPDSKAKFLHKLLGTSQCKIEDPNIRIRNLSQSRRRYERVVQHGNRKSQREVGKQIKQRLKDPGDLVQVLKSMGLTEYFLYLVQNASSFQIVQYSKSLQEYLTVSCNGIFYYSKGQVFQFSPTQFRNFYSKKTALLQIHFFKFFWEFKLIRLWSKYLRKQIKLSNQNQLSKHSFLCDNILRKCTLSIIEQFQSLQGLSLIPKGQSLTFKRFIHQCQSNINSNLNTLNIVTQRAYASTIQHIQQYIKLNYRYFKEQPMQQQFSSIKDLPTYSQRSQIKFILDSLIPFFIQLNYLIQERIQDFLYEKLSQFYKEIYNDTKNAEQRYRKLFQLKTTQNYTVTRDQLFSSYSFQELVRFDIILQSAEFQVDPPPTQVGKSIIQIFYKFVAMIQAKKICIQQSSQFKFLEGQQIFKGMPLKGHRINFSQIMFNYKDTKMIIEKLQLTFDRAEDIILAQIQIFKEIRQSNSLYRQNNFIPETQENSLLQVFRQMKVSQEKLQLLPQEFKTIIGTVSLSRLKHQSLDLIYRYNHNLLQEIPKRVQQKIKVLKRQIYLIQSSIKINVYTVEEYVSNLQTVQNASDRLAQFNLIIRDIRKGIICLQKMKMQSQASSYLQDLDVKLGSLKNKIAGWQNIKAHNFSFFKSQLKKQCLRARLQLDSLSHRIASPFFQNPNSDLKQTYFQLKQLYQSIKQLKLRFNLNQTHLISFEQQLQDDRVLNAVLSQTQFLFKIWKAKWQWEVHYQKIKEIRLNQLIIPDEKVIQFIDTVQRLSKEKLKNRVVIDLLTQSQYFSQIFQLVKDLQAQSLTDKDKQLISFRVLRFLVPGQIKLQALEFQLFPSQPHHNLQFLSDHNILKIKNQINKIRLQADSRKRIQTILKKLDFQIKEIKILARPMQRLVLQDQQLNQNILRNLQIELTSLQGGQMKRQIIMNSLRISKGLQLIQSLKQIQTQLCKVQSELGTQISQLGTNQNKTYNRSIQNYQRVLKLAKNSFNKLIQIQINQKNILPTLKQAAQDLSILRQNALQNILQRAVQVPRLMLLSDKLLYQLLSKIDRPSQLSRFLRIIFEGIKDCKFQEQFLEIGGQQGQTLKVKVELSQIIQQSVIQWIKRIQSAIKQHLKKLFFSYLSTFQREQAQFLDLLFQLPCQLALLLDQVLFFRSIQLNYLQKQSHFSINEHLSVLSKQIRSLLNFSQRYNAQNLVIQNLGFQFIIRQLIKEDCLFTYSFSWQSLLKIYADAKSVYANCLHKCIDYGWQYHGGYRKAAVGFQYFRLSKLVLTCEQQILIRGESGEGKKFIIKDLARTLGQLTILVQGNYMSQSAMQRNLKKLQTSNLPVWLIVQQRDGEPLKLQESTNFKIFNICNSRIDTSAFRGLTLIQPDNHLLFSVILTARCYHNVQAIVQKTINFLNSISLISKSFTPSIKKLTQIIDRAQTLKSSQRSQIQTIKRVLLIECETILEPQRSIYFLSQLQYYFGQVEEKETNGTVTFYKELALTSQFKKRAFSFQNSIKKGFIIVGPYKSGKSQFIQYCKAMCQETLNKTIEVQTVPSTPWLANSDFISKCKQTFRDGNWLKINSMKLDQNIVKAWEKKLQNNTRLPDWSTAIFSPNFKLIFQTRTVQHLPSPLFLNYQIIALPEDLIPQEYKLRSLLLKADPKIQPKTQKRLSSFLQGLNWHQKYSLLRLWSIKAKQLLNKHPQANRQAVRAAFQKIMAHTGLLMGVQLAQNYDLPTLSSTSFLDFSKTHIGEFQRIQFQQLNAKNNFIFCTQILSTIYLANLALQENDIVQIIGSSNSGKSSLLNRIAKRSQSSVIKVSGNQSVQFFLGKLLSSGNKVFIQDLYLNQDLSNLIIDLDGSRKIVIRNKLLALNLTTVCSQLLQAKDMNSIKINMRNRPSIYYRQITTAIVNQLFQVSRFSSKNFNKVIQNLIPFLLNLAQDLSKMPRAAYLFEFNYSPIKQIIYNIHQKIGNNSIDELQNSILNECSLAVAHSFQNHKLAMVKVEQNFDKHMRVQRKIGSTYLKEQINQNLVKSYFQQEGAVATSQHLDLILRMINCSIYKPFYFILQGQRRSGKQTVLRVFSRLMDWQLVKVQSQDHLLQLLTRPQRALLMRVSANLVQKQLTQVLFRFLSKQYLLSQETQEEQKYTVFDSELLHLTITGDTQQLLHLRHHSGKLLSLFKVFLNPFSLESTLQTICKHKVQAFQGMETALKIHEASSQHPFRVISNLVFLKRIIKRRSQQLDIIKSKRNLAITRVKISLQAIKAIELQSKQLMPRVVSLNERIKESVRAILEWRGQTGRRVRQIGELKERLTDFNNIIELHKYQIQQALNQSFPLFTRAKQIILKITRNELIELRRSALHSLQATLLELIGLLLGFAKDPDPGAKALADNALLSKLANLQAKSLTHQLIYSVQELLTRNPEINIDGLQRFGNGTLVLGQWLLTFIRGSMLEITAQHKIKALQIQLEEYNKQAQEIVQKEESLKESRAELIQKEDFLETLRSELQTINAQIQQNQKKNERAQSLKESLNDSVDSWREQFSRASQNAQTLLGDCLLAYGKLCYCMQLRPEQREKQLESIRKRIEQKYAINKYWQWEQVLGLTETKEKLKSQGVPSELNLVQALSALADFEFPLVRVIDPGDLLEQYGQCVRGYVLWEESAQVELKVFRQKIVVEINKQRSRQRVVVRSKFYQKNSLFPQLSLQDTPLLRKTIFLNLLLQHSHPETFQHSASLRTNILALRQQLSTTEEALLQELLSSQMRIIEDESLAESVQSLNQRLQLKRRQLRENQIIQKNLRIYQRHYDLCAQVVQEIHSQLTKLSSLHLNYRFSPQGFSHALALNVRLVSSKEQSIYADPQTHIIKRAAQLKQNILPAFARERINHFRDQHYELAAFLLQIILQKVPAKHLKCFLQMFDDFKLQSHDIALVRQLGIQSAKLLRLIKNSHFGLVQRINILQKEIKLIKSIQSTGSCHILEKASKFDRFLLETTISPFFFIRSLDRFLSGSEAIVWSQTPLHTLSATVSAKVVPIDQIVQMRVLNDSSIAKVFNRNNNSIKKYLQARLGTNLLTNVFWLLNYLFRYRDQHVLKKRTTQVHLHQLQTLSPAQSNWNQQQFALILDRLFCWRAQDLKQYTYRQSVIRLVLQKTRSTSCKIPQISALREPALTSSGLPQQPSMSLLRLQEGMKNLINVNSLKRFKSSVKQILFPVQVNCFVQISLDRAKQTIAMAIQKQHTLNKNLIAQRLNSEISKVNTELDQLDSLVKTVKASIQNGQEGPQFQFLKKGLWPLDPSLSFETYRVRLTHRAQYFKTLLPSSSGFNIKHFSEPWAFLQALKLHLILNSGFPIWDAKIQCLFNSKKNQGIQISGLYCTKAQINEGLLDGGQGQKLSLFLIVQSKQRKRNKGEGVPVRINWRLGGYQYEGLQVNSKNGQEYWQARGSVITDQVQ